MVFIDYKTMELASTDILVAGLLPQAPRSNVYPNASSACVVAVKRVNDQLQLHR